MRNLKNSITFSFFVMLFLCFNVEAQNMNLTGAGTSEVNGIYISTGTLNGKTYYQKGSILKVILGLFQQY